MTTRIESKGSELRDLGIDPSAPAGEALARLRAIRGSGSASETAIARALGTVVDPGAAAMLAQMEIGATGALRREIRRSLFKLQQKGITAPAVASIPQSDPAAAPHHLEPGIRAMLSAADPEGVRVVWLLKPRQQGGLVRVWGLVSDIEGLLRVSLTGLNRHELAAEREDLERRAAMKMIDADPPLADFILCEAYRRTPEVSRARVGAFLAIRADITGAPEPVEFTHPIYAELKGTLEAEPSLEILREPEASALRLSPKSIKHYVAEVASIQQSVIVLARVQQEERINMVAERAVGELFEGERALRMRRRLEDLAYYLEHTGRHAPAGWAAAAAARLRDGNDPRRIEFFRALVRMQLGAVMAEEREREREEPRLIMTPAEAIRAREQSRMRRS